METAAYVLELVPYIARNISAGARQALGDGWFTLIHLRVLGHVRRTGGCSLGNLAEQRDVSLPTMSKMVSSLVDKGLLTREPDPSNRRAVIIRLTERGDELYQSVLQRVQQDLASDIASMSPEEREELVASLERLARVMSPTGEVRSYLHLPRTIDH